MGQLTAYQFGDYQATLVALALLGVLMIAQSLVADLLGMRSGHKPGHPVKPDHGDLFFRATRAQANTNETVAIFICLAIAGLLLGASPDWLNAGALIYLAGRVAHMAMYYANQQLPRSGAFAVGVVGQVVMAGAVVQAMF